MSVDTDAHNNFELAREPKCANCGYKIDPPPRLRVILGASKKIHGKDR